MISQFEQRILALIDENVEHASDDELFAGGYLRGHVTLAAAQAEAQGEDSLEAYSELIEQSLDGAIAAGELSPPDRALVFETWNALKARVA
ncbi:YfcL family protein [Leminorella grimontii]|uniref:YfcL family protein n=1 Tax=Leminorella grimontii TaxID=82981 RepID=UPI00321FD69F